MALTDHVLDLYRGVSDAELLCAHGLFVAEGRLLVRRVLENARFRVHSLLLNDAARRDLENLIRTLPPAVPVLTVATSEFQNITGFDMHRGCLALVHRPVSLCEAEILGYRAPVVILEGITNADNVGSVFRNAAALGACGVIVTPGCCDPFYRKAVRTSMGAVLNVPFARAEDWPEGLTRARGLGFIIAALTPQEPSELLGDFAVRAKGCKVALLVGTEGNGLSEAALAKADVRVRIPLVNGVDSLNLSVATAVALYALRS
jgi:tRNA G18 (ribose-2'-O)-methylase SpoU